MAEQSSMRRRFLVQAAVAATALPVLGKVITQSAYAAPAKLPASNAQAKALNYVEDASKVKHSLYKAGSTCANCQLFTAATGACAIFAGYTVASAGWCSAWAKKA